jgi:hypothetical protein
MTKAPPACTKCWTPLPAEFLNIEEFQACPSCNSMVRLEVFPAYFREVAKGSSGEAVLADTEASCFYHPQKRAAVVCSECGRFLCSLCDLELEGKHFCASCLEAAKEKNKIASIQNTRQLKDVLAFHLALLGFLPYVTIGTAPVAIYLSIKHWKSPSSIVRGPSRARFIAAIVIASLQIVGTIAVIGFFVSRFYGR